MFDRSWYDRAGVERVMGFLTPEQHSGGIVPSGAAFEGCRRDGIRLTKFWFSVSPSEQRTRFTIRQVDPVRRWKLSPTDLASLDKSNTTPPPRTICSPSTDTEYRAVDTWCKERRQETRTDDRLFDAAT